jgi:hypothetical protein
MKKLKLWTKTLCAVLLPLMLLAGAFGCRTNDGGGEKNGGGADLTDGV